jgi:hypothetical protein
MRRMTVFLNFSQKQKCVFEEVISLLSKPSVIKSLIIMVLMTPVAVFLLRHIFSPCLYKLKPRIHKTGHHSWQDWKQMENCGRMHQIRGWPGTSSLKVSREQLHTALDKVT